MPAISKAWVVIADVAVDPDSPVDTVLMTGYRDDVVHLREWLGASFFAGAVQDHNHDGANSALIETGPNYQRNGSFETSLASWVTVQFAGGTVALTAATQQDGASSIAFTSTVLANGGGNATSANFTNITGGRSYLLSAVVKASVANVSAKMEVNWYDNAQALVSTTIAYTTANAATGFRIRSFRVRAPTAARYAKVVITGAIPAVGAATGTINFDGLVFSQIGGDTLAAVSIFTANGTYFPALTDSRRAVGIAVGGGGGGGSGTGAQAGGGGAGGGCAVKDIPIDSLNPAGETVTIGAGGAGNPATGPGGNGGTTSLGAIISATGGQGGTAAGGGASAGGAGTGGDMNIPGDNGGANVGATPGAGGGSDVSKSANGGKGAFCGTLLLGSAIPAGNDGEGRIGTLPNGSAAGDGGIVIVLEYV